MSEQKLTDWFPAKTKPTLPGVYQCRGMFATKVDTYQYWDGERWGGWHVTPHGAHADRDMPSARQRPEWRGLASDPSKAG